MRPIIVLHTRPPFERALHRERLFKTRASYIISCVGGLHFRPLLVAATNKADLIRGGFCRPRTLPRMWPKARAGLGLFACEIKSHRTGITPWLKFLSGSLIDLTRAGIHLTASRTARTETVPLQAQTVHAQHGGVGGKRAKRAKQSMINGRGARKIGSTENTVPHCAICRPSRLLSYGRHARTASAR